MRVAVISDTHGREGWIIPECDVFVHAGDLTAGGSANEAFVRLGYMRGLIPPRVPMVVVPGNHDGAFETELDRIQGVIANHPFGEIHILIDQGIQIGGKLFYGSPWTPPFMQWAFMKPEDELQKLYAETMPDEIDMLITHGPPRGILDLNWQANHGGSEALLEAIRKRTVGHHVFGHLHEAGGQSVKRGKTHFYNVAAVDEAYCLKRGCRIIEL